MSVPKVYVRAALALLLPLGLWLIVREAFWETCVTWILRQSWGKYVLAGSVVLVLVAQSRFLITLGRLVRAGGSGRAYRALEADPVEQAARRRVRFRLAAVALSLLAAFAITEITFRLFDIRPPPPPRASSLDSDEVDNTLNALGIREPWDALPPGDRRLRVAFLGDSMVYGHSVAAEETFVHRLEEMLQKDWETGVVTMNFGFPVTAPGEQLEKYLPLREALHPDVVVQVVYLNDLGVMMHFQLYQIYRTRDDELTLGRASYLLYYLEKQIRYWSAWRQTINYFRGGDNPVMRAKNWARFEKDVRACKAAVEEDGAVYALVLFPWLVRLDDYLLTDVHERMRRFAERLGVPYLDLLEVFAGRDEAALRVSPINEHPTPLGHAIAAERLARFLREEILPGLRGRARETARHN
ncbi:MAG: SGNH/GDSL hydrolase family protein [Phycisphaerae bacterium]